MCKFELHHGDCLDVMATLPDASVDCVLTDPPYRTTACKWDSVIPFELMWKELKRIAKPKAAIVLFGSQPFTSALVMSNPDWYRHKWVWEKSKAASFATCNTRPLTVDEDVIVFGQPGVKYFPQMKPLYKPFVRSFVGNQIKTSRHQTAPIASDIPDRVLYEASHPRSILRVPSVFDGKEHPTQKPVELLRYLIRTYTHEGETVLDFTMGSGSTGVACELENRNFIGIESDEGYFEIAKKRITDVKAKEPLFMEVAA